MGKESEARGVAGDAAFAFDNSCGVLLDGLLQFGGTIESMNSTRQSMASSQIGGLGRPHGASRDATLQRSSLHAGERFADIEAEACIE